MSLEQSWRWFGPKDVVTLSDARQAGATAIVSALHHIPNGDVWPVGEILRHNALIDAAGLKWLVVESVPVHDDIKKRAGNYQLYIDNYKQTLTNLSHCGITTVCYNFMPVLDWTRTDLAYPLPDGSTALRFDMTAFAAFDIFILKRPGAVNNYPIHINQNAEQYFRSLTPAGIDKLTNNIIAGLPGAEAGYSVEEFLQVLQEYKDIDTATLKANLYYFLQQIIPTAEQLGIHLCIHPDDPPYPILGLPRVVSTEQDIADLYNAVNSYYNGLTFCTGSFGVRADNDLPGMVKRLGKRIHFVHLRSTKRNADGDFFEAGHLTGDVDMYAVVKALLEEQKNRAEKGDCDTKIPFRPDHGHQMLDDIGKDTNPGYSAIGRLKGLAELRGLELGIKRALDL